jgi:hypothetical protein
MDQTRDTSPDTPDAPSVLNEHGYLNEMETPAAMERAEPYGDLWRRSMHKLMRRSGPRDFQTNNGAAQNWKLHWKPRPWPLVYWSLAGLCIFAIFKIKAVFGFFDWDSYNNGWIALMGLTFLAIGFVIAGAPAYKPVDWKLSDDARDMRDHETFRERMREND